MSVNVTGNSKLHPSWNFLFDQLSFIFFVIHWHSIFIKVG